ncbi:oligosaccharide flippase family protein [Flavobacterium pectinovorum]|uniref:oligosaccharide flippase family protein n=1 Tax=Flavobacterium pectinovorum TaxID=29533 RepID=UPI001FAD8B2C|nr:oligosaccharide flippase family protein [Flavobacterium pectinovorum]MCI9846282.1 oligosaccharide flippase family protein [Flavobacterium pectinovorum]
MIEKEQQKSTSIRVALNTGVLYARMLISMGISFYSVRLVLNALGTADFGLFNLITGVIVMFTFLNAAMTTSTQRYLSFHQGTGDLDMQVKVFANSWILHIIIGFVIVAVLLALSPFFFDGFLNIPVDRVSTAKSIYYFLAGSMFFTVVTVPFTALLNAHENMLWLAVVMVIESFLKLVVAFSLTWFAEEDRLFFYGFLMAGVTIVSFLLYAIFCLKKYNECSIRSFAVDKILMKELGSFAGWNLFANICYVLNTQGINVLLNVFFGIIVNAAYGIANQVNGQVRGLSFTLLQALNPQIMKSEGMNNRERMLRTAMWATKLGFFLVAFFAIPLIFQMSVVLKFWLKNVPEHTDVFCSLFLIATLINQLTVGITPAIQAMGNIKNFQITIGSVALLTLPICYLSLKYGGMPTSFVFVVIVAVEIITGFLKIVILKKQSGVQISEYLKSVIKMVIPICITCAIVYLATNWIHSDIRIVLTLAISFILFPVVFYFIGLDSVEKNQIVALIQRLLPGKEKK